jgi:hypothetical protein
VLTARLYLSRSGQLKAGVEIVLDGRAGGGEQFLWSAVTSVEGHCETGVCAVCTAGWTARGGAGRRG